MKNSGKDKTSTLDKIHDIAAKEFLSKGFQGASLREIVKKAGVTTGAFYGYYKSKEELFQALVKDTADYFLSALQESYSTFKKLSDREQTEQLHDFVEDNMNVFFNYMFTHKIELNLLLKCSAGTKYESFLDKISAHEELTTIEFIQTLEKSNPGMEKIKIEVVSVISRKMIQALFEPLTMDIPQEEAIRAIRQIQHFYEAGWNELFFSSSLSDRTTNGNN